MEYKTIEGHEIKVGECYQTRHNRKVFVSYVGESPKKTHHCIVGAVADSFGVLVWFNDGIFNKIHNISEMDLMRPWPKEKIEVTDEMIQLGLESYQVNVGWNLYKKLAMKAALEAVFEHFSSSSKKSSDSIFESFPPELPLLDEKQPDNDGWIEWKGGKCPVDDDLLIEFKDFYGKIWKNLAKNEPWEKSNRYPSFNIMAYRIIKQESDYQHYPQGLDADGWLVHDGGKCPVANNVEVEQVFKVNIAEKASSIGLAKDVYWPNVIRYRIVKQEPKKKVYKLNDMWKIWWHVEDKPNQIYSAMSSDKKELELPFLSSSGKKGIILAITRADAIEFFEGEGLD